MGLRESITASIDSEQASRSTTTPSKRQDKRLQLPHCCRLPSPNPATLCPKKHRNNTSSTSETKETTPSVPTIKKENQPAGYGPRRVNSNLLDRLLVNQPDSSASGSSTDNSAQANLSSINSHSDGSPSLNVARRSSDSPN
ncbi:uncharacterized protein BYT42DRAFT_541990 [Radiomyces spectabilis]|uniref:uncharacterized protein n=1 Tax=Radiomyces spectabilis TaxID=64574 RepID=UPI00221ECB0F|nr:uncharacterized protein BYT42DRAFT_550434 [Radiomyces spectabilis]XP_051428315.1 uncharacterized protein BYT42DRAFT_541990 [Radiomyces spectabilis]KAI8364148.1 hypothetical protein BYT42DRAFT_550434 [Radiomyces spectabilis]KAI8393782.1 hypothetical protein BYT42DRAFT_541990 [Radiomyces spectabilis]